MTPLHHEHSLSKEGFASSQLVLHFFPPRLHRNAFIPMAVQIDYDGMLQLHYYATHSQKLLMDFFLYCTYPDSKFS
jgi:hypothetical protein